MTHSKHFTRRRVLQATATVAAGLAAPTFLKMSPAFAAYPDRPVRIVVANTPGGPSDIIARIMAASMQEAMPGSSFIVENKGGAGGNIGMGYVARSDADGYTILLSTSAFSVNPGLYNQLVYDPFKDFAPICELAVSPHVFAVQPSLGVKTMKEFVELAKKDQDKFNVSVPPVGTTPQLQAEVLKLRAGLLRALDSNAGLAGQLASTWMSYGDWRKLFTAIQEIEQVTADAPIYGDSVGHLESGVKMGALP